MLMLINQFQVINVFAMMDIIWMHLIIANYVLTHVLNVQIQVHLAQTVLAHLYQVDLILVFVVMDIMKKQQIHQVIVKFVLHHAVNVK